MDNLRELIRLPFAQKLELIEAFFWLCVAWLIRTFIPFKIWIGKLGTPDSETATTALAPNTEARVCDVRSSLSRISHVSPRPLRNCLVESIAAKLMLKRRGIGSTLYLSVTTDHSQGELYICGHAWVRCGTIIIGGTGQGLTELFKLGE